MVVLIGIKSVPGNTNPILRKWVKNSHGKNKILINEILIDEITWYVSMAKTRGFFLANTMRIIKEICFWNKT